MDYAGTYLHSSSLAFHTTVARFAVRSSKRHGQSTKLIAMVWLGEESIVSRWNLRLENVNFFFPSIPLARLAGNRIRSYSRGLVRENEPCRSNRRRKGLIRAETLSRLASQHCLDPYFSMIFPVTAIRYWSLQTPRRARPDTKFNLVSHNNAKK